VRNTHNIFAAAVHLEFPRRYLAQYRKRPQRSLKLYQRCFKIQQNHVLRPPPKHTKF